MGGVTKNATMRRQLITVCTACRRAITAQHAAVWQRGEVMGLVHRDCADDAHATTVDLSHVVLSRLHYNEHN